MNSFLKPFLKNNYKEVFKSADLFTRYRQQLSSILREKNFFTSEELNEIEESLCSNEKDLLAYFDVLKHLIAYTLINEPIITIE